MIFENVFRSSDVNLTITLSHKLSEIGLTEREAASIMNASLLQMAERVVGSF